MFFYGKKIVYLSLYEQDERTASAGFASIQGERDGIRLTIQIRIKGNAAVGGQPDAYPVYLAAGEREIPVGALTMEPGGGRFERLFPCQGDRAVICGEEALPEEIAAVRVSLNGGRRVYGEWKPGARPQKYPSGEAERKKPEEEPAEASAVEAAGERESVFGAAITETAAVPALGKELKAVSVSSDKWEQLKRQYKTVHPFGDEREFISIELKDFVILRENYQKLANNSFLLHGFYNYRHLLLGRDYQMGEKGGVCFYIGVPGVFFEREKMVAVMFGFEGFEAAGPVEIGKFGYYLRRVEI